MNYAKPTKLKYGKYLFCYFLGNKPEEERVCFAVSDDGYNFTPLNNNEPIIIQNSGTRCCRDPYIVRGQNDDYYIIATDMKCSLGWDSNHGVVSWHSDNLTDWQDECVVDFHDFSATADADKIWAPEAIYDSSRGEYMVYYSVGFAHSDGPISIWHSYTKDFKTYTDPKPLFSPKVNKDTIDADIVFTGNEFFMSYKDENVKTVAAAVSKYIDGPYVEFDNNVITCTDKHVEGNCCYNINGTDTWVVIMDLYVDGGYFMQQTDDFVHFYPVEAKDFSLDFHPRHGSMLTISDEEYNRLTERFGR